MLLTDHFWYNAAYLARRGAILVVICWSISTVPRLVPAGMVDVKNRSVFCPGLLAFGCRDLILEAVFTLAGIVEVRMRAVRKTVRLGGLVGALRGTRRRRVTKTRFVRLRTML